jgi:formate hydrogenlyase subunit 6/NADH:ubiquinone oxidoreductase subunit I
MKKQNFSQFLDSLKKEGYALFGDFNLTGKIPPYSYKKYLLPPQETLFKFTKNRIEENFQSKKQALVGLTLPDLRALILFDHVFEKDPYYQKRRQNTLVIGQSLAPEDELVYQSFELTNEENLLEHVKFDLFFQNRRNKLQIISGSSLGSQILEKLKIKDFDYVEFAGPIKEEGPEPRMLKIKAKLEKKYQPKIWEELGKICVACGKCSLVCPTCFCFFLEDEISPDQKGSRQRLWNSCFYNHFSKTSSGHQALDSVAKKIYFWYYHKFVRIPAEYKFPGCVSCGRCDKACPAKIKIQETLAKILKS